MGKYINEVNGEELGISFEDKCAGLEKHGATRIDPTEFVENLICVVENGFGAAAYMYNQSEYDAFMSYVDTTKQWYVMPNASEHAN